MNPLAEAGTQQAQNLTGQGCISLWMKKSSSLIQYEVYSWVLIEAFLVDTAF